MPWSETMVVVSSNKSQFEEDPSIAQDDLKRELAFYKQALDAANQGRELCKKEKIPFTRPSDFFAEMIKTDSHMARVRQKLVDEAASFKKSEEARKMREHKKFGKKVQVEKIKERSAQKKAELEKVKVAKKKKGSSDFNEMPGILPGMKDRNGEDFDIEVDQMEDTEKPRKQKKEIQRNVKRSRKDEKYGFGGKKRNSKPF